MTVDFLIDARRIFDLIRTALKYGADPAIRRIFNIPPHPPTAAVRLRLALEELGLTYLKIGQYLSTRFDALPYEVCLELNNLLENVAPVPFPLAKAVIETALQAPISELFSEFHEIPIASGSVAQVYEARTLSGDRVAVKVQRPGIQQLFAADIRNLKRVGALLNAFEVLGSLSVVEMIEAFQSWTSRELDFRQEGQTADRLRAEMVEGEMIPRVYWQLTTAKVLTLEYVEGLSLSRLAVLVEQGKMETVRSILPRLDIKRIGHILATACLNQFFITGFFHGDPHPGNIIVRKDNTVAFIDFGIFGELSEYQREMLLGHIQSIAMGNISLSFYYYAKQAIPSAETDHRQFAREGTAILRRWYESSRDPFATADQRHLGRYSAEMFDTIRRNRVRMDATTLLFWRAMNVLASTAIRVPGYFDLLGEMRTYFSRMRLGPERHLFDPAAVNELCTQYFILGLSVPGYGEVLNMHQRVGDCRVSESRETSRSENLYAKRLAASILGFSLFAMSFSAYPAWIGILFVCLGSLFILWPLQRRSGDDN